MYERSEPCEAILKDFVKIDGKCKVLLRIGLDDAEHLDLYP